MNLLLESGGVSALLETLSAKTVLVLGRFTPKRKAFFDLLKDELFRRNYVAISFDFAQPTTRSLSETLMLLAGLSRFIVADLTDPKSVPAELARIIPQFQVPVAPLIRRGETPFAMFDDMFRLYPWVLAPTVYQSAEDINELLNRVVGTAEAKIGEHMNRLRQQADTGKPPLLDSNTAENKRSPERSARTRPKVRRRAKPS